MNDTKIEMKLEEETKKLGKICEQLQEAIQYEFDKGIEQVDVEEMGKVIDMLKDIYEAKEKIVKSCYYTYILGAMEKEEEEEKAERKMMEKMRDQYNEEDEDEERRFYRGQPRSKTSGRFMSRGDGRRSYMMTPEMYREYPAEYYRDMDRINGRMYYPNVNTNGGMNSNMGGNTRNYSDGYSDGLRDGRTNESRYDKARRNYTETKQMHKGNTPEDNSENMKKLEELLNTINEGVVKEYAPKMTPSEKAMTVQKLESWVKELKQV